MKAKEYAEMYLKSDDKENTIVAIARLFLLEINSLSKARNAKLDTALIPICIELNKKWIKFADIVNKKLPVSRPIAYSSFKFLVRNASPELYSIWYNSSK